MTNNEKMYQYTECGLDNVYLKNGFDTSGKSVSIKNIEGLHNAIGLFLVTQKKDLNGRELRFLRHELLMSQSTLGRLVGTGVQSINRWENCKSDVPKPAENLVRLLYIEQMHPEHGTEIKKQLREIADLEDAMSRNLTMKTDKFKGWSEVREAA